MSKPLPPSALALAEVLAGDSPASVKIKAAFGRMTLWRWCNGHRVPRVDSAVKLHALCRRVRPDGWTRAEADRAA